MSETGHAALIAELRAKPAGPLTKALMRRAADALSAADEQIAALRAQNFQLFGEACFVHGHDVPETEAAARAVLLRRAIEAERERDDARAALRPAFDAGYRAAWDHCPITDKEMRDEAFAAFIRPTPAGSQEPR